MAYLFIKPGPQGPSAVVDAVRRATCDRVDCIVQPTIVEVRAHERVLEHVALVLERYPVEGARVHLIRDRL